MNTPSKEDLAYTAGLVDGEGTVSLTRKGRSFRHPSVNVSSCTYVFMEFLKENFGGHISSKKVVPEGHSAAWSWAIHHDAALEFLELIEPYLKEPEKRRRVHLLLTEYKALTVRNGKYTPEQKASKLAFEEKFFSVQRECQRKRTKMVEVSA